MAERFTKRLVLTNPISPGVGSRVRYTRDVRLVLALLLGVTVFRLWFSTRLELVGDEAYYWLWSRHLDYCYLDKGPMIAWAIKLGTLLFGSTVFGVRFFAVLAAGGTGWGIFLLARRLFDGWTGFWAVALALVAPLFAVGATLMTIDTLHVFFWTWAALAFWQAKESGRFLPWLVTGCLVGCGILSKYTALMELFSFTLFCAWSPLDRRHLRQPGFYLMIGVALLFLLPTLFWNAQHGWPTTRWLGRRGGLDQPWHVRPLEALTFLSGQAGVISPLLFLGLLAVIRWPRLTPPLPAREVRFTLALFLPLLLLYLVLSLQKAGQPNWAAAAYVGGLILLARRWREVWYLHRWARWLTATALAVALLETGVLHGTAWLHLPSGKDPLDRARGSRDLAAAVERAQERTGARFVITNRYMTSALMSFYLPAQPPTYLLSSEFVLNQIQLWPGYQQSHPTEDGLWVSDLEPAPRTLRTDFARVELLETHDATEDGRLVKRFYLYRCRRSAPEANGVFHGRVDAWSQAMSPVEAGRSLTTPYALLLVCLLWAGVYLPGLGSLPLKHEEPRRALPAVYMSTTGDWLVPRLGATPYLRKPPLLNWLIALSFRVSGGRTEFAARLPSVLAMLALGLTVVATGRGWLGVAGALLAAIFVLTNLAAMETGRLAELEALYLSLTGNRADALG